jgi:RHS repeat-associated protein
MTWVENSNSIGPCPQWASNPSTNQLSASGFIHDAAGNMTGDGVNTYSWSAEAHLNSAAGVTYTYDGDRRRVEKSSGTLYWYCASCGRVLAESDLSGNLTSEYTFFNQRRIARRDVSSGNVYYIFTDRLGSYRTLTDSSGNVQGESDYYPFGAERVISSTVTDSFRFAGMEWDSETGLNHTLYRQYTPAQCRWETPDPVRGCVNFPQGQNLYAYVMDNPTNFTDRSGEQPFPPPPPPGEGGPSIACQMCMLACRVRYVVNTVYCAAAGFWMGFTNCANVAHEIYVACLWDCQIGPCQIPAP